MYAQAVYPTILVHYVILAKLDTQDQDVDLVLKALSCLIASANLASLVVMSALINQPVQHALLGMLHQTVLHALQDMLEIAALIVLVDISIQLVLRLVCFVQL